jgi:hypothetical protein
MSSKKLASALLMLVAPLSAGADENPYRDAAVKILQSLGAILDANNEFWDKVNTIQVNLALGKMRDAARSLSNKKSELKKGILDGTLNEQGVDQRVDNLITTISVDLVSALRGFETAMNTAAANPTVIDPLTDAVRELEEHKLKAVGMVREAFQKGRQDAANQLDAAIIDDGKVYRALGCVQQTIANHAKPAAGCDF